MYFEFPLNFRNEFDRISVYIQTHTLKSEKQRNIVTSSHRNIMTMENERRVSNTMRRIVWLNIGAAHSIEGVRQFLTERSFDKTINIHTYIYIQFVPTLFLVWIRNKITSQRTAIQAKRVILTACFLSKIIIFPVRCYYHIYAFSF